MLGFPCGSTGKESACNAGDLCSIPGLARSPGERKGSPLQYSCLGNPVDRGAWWAVIHGITKKPNTSQRISNNIGINKSQSSYKALQSDSCSQKWVYPECLMWLCEPFHITVLITGQYSMQLRHHHLREHIFTIGVWLAVPKAFFLFWSPLK